MTGLLYTVAPLALACVIARREPAHRPIRDALAAMMLYSAAQLAGPLPSVVSWALWLAMPLTSARVYASAWGWTIEDATMVIGLIGLIGFAVAVNSTIAPADMAAWAPFVASSLVGLLALLAWLGPPELGRVIVDADGPRWVRTAEDRAATRAWMERGPMSLTQRSAVAMLASDVAMLLFVPWPGVQAWQGRAMALAMAVIQGIWLIERRST
jgi:hypothetical protein